MGTGETRLRLRGWVALPVGKVILPVGWVALPVGKVILPVDNANMLVQKNMRYIGSVGLKINGSVATLLWWLLTRSVDNFRTKRLIKTKRFFKNFRAQRYRWTIIPKHDFRSNISCFFAEIFLRKSRFLFYQTKTEPLVSIGWKNAKKTNFLFCKITKKCKSCFHLYFFAKKWFPLF